jgi:carboxypeptidase C (cathepsin A)
MLPMILVLAVSTLGTAARADDEKDSARAAVETLCQTKFKSDDKGKKEDWKREPMAERSVTQHHLSVGGKPLDYTATAGILVIRDDADKPIANIGLHRLYQA